MKNIYLEKSLGIDIREESVAITLLGKTFRSVNIIDADYFKIPFLSEDKEKSEKFFLEKVNSFLIKTSAWPENLAISLPRTHYSFQSFELPAPDLKSAHAMVPFELERNFSSNIDNLYFGYHASQIKDNLFHVMSVAVKKETAHYYLELLGQLNLKPGIIDVSTFSNANLILTPSTEDLPLSAVVDIGSQGIELSLLKDRNIHFSKNVAFNDPEFKRGFFQTDLDESYYKSIASGLAKIIIEQLQYALESSRNIDEAESVERIYLLGAGPYNPYLVAEIQQRAEVSTTRVGIPSDISDDSNNSFSTTLMATSLSLGLRELKQSEIEANFLSAELKPRRKKHNIKFTLGLAAAAVFLLIGLFVNKIIHQNVTIASLDRQLNEVKTQAKSLQEIDREFDYLGNFINTLNSIEKKFPSKLPILAELSKTLSQDTWLTNIKIDKNNMEISGYSKTASRLVPILESSPYFNKTRFVGSITNRKEGEKFTIQTELQGNP
jgi:Tfp pilus assembly PilM family ATPase/Tfp pilus assembly protein PilN